MRVAADASIVRPTFVLMLLCLVPAIIFYFGDQLGASSSLAPGTAISCILFVAMAASRNDPGMSPVRLVNYASAALVVVGLLLVHLVGAKAVGSGTEPTRALASIPLLLLLLAGGVALATMLRQDSNALPNALALVRWLLVGLTLLAILGIKPFPGGWEKPIFPFSEPSHLALVITPFLMHAAITHRGWSRALWIAGGIALAYGAESLTMLMGMVLTALICLPPIGVLVAGLAAAAGSALLDIQYFVARLDFDAGTQNLSSLVYRQGWELVIDALTRTSGWGVGFQQLGYAPFHSASADALFVILRDDANTRDGGFLLAKIVSELGGFGCLLVVGYLVVAGRATLIVRRLARNRSVTLPPHVVFALCSICTFSVEMFVRDVGYFAGSVLLFIASLYMLWEHRTPVRRSATTVR